MKSEKDQMMKEAAAWICKQSRGGEGGSSGGGI